LWSKKDDDLSQDFWEWKKNEDKKEKPMAKHIVSLHTIKNLIKKKSSHLHLLLAVTVILKHATFLRCSMSSKSALANAEQKYQKSNIDVLIQDHLTTCAAEQSVEQFVGFIMSTDIMSSQSSAHTSV